MSDAVDSETYLRSGPEETRRDFLYLTAGAMAAVGTALAVWPLIDSMNPAADVRALVSVVVPTMRPGSCRLCASLQVKRPTYAPP